MGGKEGKKKEPERCRSAQMDVMAAGSVSPHRCSRRTRSPCTWEKRSGERVGG